MWRMFGWMVSFWLLFASAVVLPAYAENVEESKPRQESNDEKCLLRYDQVEIQLPVRQIEKNGDYLSDIVSFEPLFGLHVERQRDKILIYKGTHVLVAHIGQRGAFLDGRLSLLRVAPEVREGHILFPIKQTLDLLQIPYREERRQIVLTGSLPLIGELQKAISEQEDKQSIGYVSILAPGRLLVAARPWVYGREHGFSALYELRLDRTWKAAKLRMISDTSANVYLEWMPGGTVLENVAIDARPEFIFVETCQCTGGYHYATMFTLTERGVQPIWHSSAIFSHVEKRGKRYELVTIRKENIPERNAGVLPYWVVHETWNGQGFVITKEEYQDPSKLKR
jgi:hypothetical protein